MNKLSCHVLDTSNGHPAANIVVKLFRLGSFECLAEETTNADGRAVFEGITLDKHNFTLRFLVQPYCEEQFGSSFFPMIDVHFTVADERNYHIPLLLSPYSYSSYRGS
ncbi:hydroxyisourate hydrolase [Vibrio ziniensis]|uniref:5-hydroxyisourate hydrolase n=1 Tax=Vibrio ziniensis TaxID=2711221 RepID=A0A6G7CHV8_9VIBR|nr:hydroxyisourate hydrolase [Vibrio ziniensis]QIH41643.1 hydroxyisourate hydrolase [Vibrio ziniensis]